MADAGSSQVAETRRPQIYPVLTDAELKRIDHFGERKRFRDGDFLARTGQDGPGMCVVLSGRIVILRHAGLGHISPIVEMGPGEFAAELAELSGQPALVDVRAIGDVDSLIIPPDGLRALMVAEAELGERLMRSLILRRVFLIESNAAGPILVGELTLPGMIRLQSFLTRNGQPYSVIDPERDPDAAQMIARLSPDPEDYPLAVCPDGTILRNPSEQELAICIGLLDQNAEPRLYDIAIVGAGPAGLSTAVYAASEGLQVLVVETRAFGGQAGASNRIENYLGFPTGITGQALTARAFVQAQKFGAQFIIPLSVAHLDCSGGLERPMTLEMDDGWRVQARTVVIASGARYRKLALPNLGQFLNRGIWYWASPIEAKLCANAEVIIVGGGNSAGQAAVFLAAHAAKVWILVRGEGLAETMSRYLIDRIDAASNIEVLAATEIVELIGSEQDGLQKVRWRDRTSGEDTVRLIRHVFLFLGAAPATEWLKDCGIDVDRTGFIRTGTDVEAPCPDRPPQAYETNVQGVFAVGDVRYCSVKRVGAAIGEGANVVAAVHGVLQAIHAAE
ncbi:cyclic nucleotide-binding domain-containing thioredoxin-disulfide reductase [Reyranella sp.]|uniref:FAD-dependent oxidoreductase n=1 Tax=Reyranella sp. TaxID=1929291 RepID=UPI00272F3A34|nr:cyclic nucleotide-binding domain-containing thioredoxin-disulfide reductase [Reyranella sp.]MDP2372389.1 FAD-dependent oxidoreductase [Reyranella sp.]